MECTVARNEAADWGVRTWLLAALHPFVIDTGYFDDLGQALDLSAPTVEC